MNNSVKLLQQAAHLTEDMLSKASNQKWSALPELQNQRAELLRQVFPWQEAEQTEVCRTLLEQLIDSNHRLETVCREAQQDLQIELSGLNKNRKAVAAYQSS